jgi:hypothetical protein
VLRKIILNVHIYGGLLCFSYLVLFGISVLNFNHFFAFTKPPASVVTWSRPMVMPELAKPDAKKDAQTVGRDNNRLILQALGSFAAPSPSVTGDWTDADTYHAHYTRPGKELDVDVHPSRGVASISQTRTGVWTQIRDLHGSAIVYPESRFASTWGWYTELCTFVVLSAGVSGVYLWAVGRRERRIGLITLAAAGAVSLALMLLVTFRG